jgi:putative ABC transport system permease protein
VADTVDQVEPKALLIFGVEPGKLGSPEPKIGTALSGPGQIVIDDSLGYRVGETVPLGELQLTVVGMVHGASILAGTPTAFVSLGDSQTLLTQDKPIISAILTDAPRDSFSSLAGTRAVSRSSIRDDAMRLLKDAQKTISMIMAMLWGVAALIVGSAVYLSALERTRDMAVMKATGASTASLAGGILLQALIVSVIAALIGAVLAVFLAPVFPMNVEIPMFGFVLLGIVAIVVAALASLAGLRKAVGVDPAVAFAGP